MVEITIVKLSDDAPFSLSLLQYISFERRVRIMNYRSIDDKRRSLISELLIRKTVKEKLNIPFHKIKISYNQHGKPYIDNVRHFKFNISHSGCYVVIAVSTQRVGVDIEQIQPIDMGVAKRFFTEKEYKYLEGLSSEDKKLSEFFKLWTLKESYTKAIGKGLKISLKTFEFDIKSNKSFIIKNKSETFFFCTKRIADYFMSVCSMEKNIYNDYKMFDEQELYDYFKGNCTSGNISNKIM